ncbi:MAG: DUF3987 domain-containing protein [Desulfovibrionaceae bacterium]|nr:DUF3987 domain-containing protein [Desulfovibrionaceae bacterium]
MSILIHKNAHILFANPDLGDEMEIEDEFTTEDESIHQGSGMLKAALIYAQKGKPVFPCNLNKTPLTLHGFKDATTDPVQIQKWWTKWPDASIGMPTGPASGRWVLDVDLPDGPATLEALEAAHGKLPPTPTQQTGSGGKHYFFLYPEGRKVKYSTSKIGLKLDVKGEGGYVIVAPSGHPSGGQYQWLTGKQPAAEAPEWLLDLVCEQPGQVLKKKATPVLIKNELQTGENTAYGLKALEEEVAKVASAPVGSRNETLLKAVAALRGLAAGGELNWTEAEAVLINAAKSIGLEAGEIHATIASGMKYGAVQPRSAPNSAGAPEVLDPSNPMPAPIPFGMQKLPKINPDVLPPGILREISLAVANHVQVPFELAWINALGALSITTQRKFLVMVREGYIEPLNLYLVCPLQSGGRKSDTVAACKKPLTEWEAARFREIRDIILEAESERKTIGKVVETKRTKAAHAKTIEDRNQVIKEIKEIERGMPEVPVAPRLVADDITPEGLAVLMTRHKQRMGIMQAEGGIFDLLSGRYSKGVPNLDLVLKSWSGEPFHVDRAKGDPLYLRNPHITMCISPQPETLQKITAFRGRGLAARFLYLLPDSLLGNRADEGPPIPGAISDTWRSTLHNLLNMPWALDQNGEETAYTIRLSPGAYSAWLGFSRSVETRLRPGGEFEYMTDWAGKFPGQVIRLAGIFHCASVSEPHQSEISEAIMRSALNVAETLATHAKAALIQIGTNPAQECALAILRWIERTEVMKFSARDAHRAVSGKFSTMKEVSAGLVLLEERAYIFLAAPVSHQGVGRKPGTTYIVNPQIWEQNMN